jgi:hypothetical protein
VLGTAEPKPPGAAIATPEMPKSPAAILLKIAQCKRDMYFTPKRENRMLSIRLAAIGQGTQSTP